MSLFNEASLASLIFRLCQLMCSSLTERWWPVFTLCSLIADRGLRQDRCSLTRASRCFTHYVVLIAIRALFCLSGAPAQC